MDNYLAIMLFRYDLNILIKNDKISILVRFSIYRKVLDIAVKDYFFANTINFQGRNVFFES